MTKDKFLIGFYWQNRRLTIRQAAAFAAGVADILKKYIPEFEIPCFLNRNASTTPVCLDDKDRAVTELSLLLLKYWTPAIKEYHPGIEPSVDFSEQVPFVFSLQAKSNVYNGSYRVSFMVGGVGINNVILTTPKENKDYSFLLIKDLFIELNAFITPDYSFIASRKIQDLQKLPEFFFGWMNYFSNAIELPGLPDDFITEKLPGLGKIVITTNEEFDAVSNPDHCNKAMQLVEIFRVNNVMRPGND